jgi:hypothetical protein
VRCQPWHAGPFLWTSRRMCACVWVPLPRAHVQAGASFQQILHDGGVASVRSGVQHRAALLRGCTQTRPHTRTGWLPPPVCAALGCVRPAWVASTLGPRAAASPLKGRAGLQRARGCLPARGVRAVLGAWCGRGLLLWPAVVSWIRHTTHARPVSYTHATTSLARLASAPAASRPSTAAASPRPAA